MISIFLQVGTRYFLATEDDDIGDWRTYDALSYKNREMQAMVGYSLRGAARLLPDPSWFIYSPSFHERKERFYKCNFLTHKAGATVPISSWSNMPSV